MEELIEKIQNMTAEEFKEFLEAAVSMINS